MLNVTGLNQFYYLRDFTDMRCKHSRVLSIIREQLHRDFFLRWHLRPLPRHNNGR